MSQDTRFSLLLKAAQRSAEATGGHAFDALALEAKSRISVVNGENSQWFADMLAALQAPDYARDASPGRINCLIDACHYLYVAGRPLEAVAPAVVAVNSARICGDLPLLRKALSFKGVICADTGDISTAIECYAEAIEIARRIRDLDAECMVWINLGVAFHYAAQYPDALACHEHALRLADEHVALRKHRAPALTNIALCSLHLQNFERGLYASERAIDESPEPKTAAEMLSRVLRENNYARLLLEVNSYEKALERSKIARRYASASNLAKAEVSASIIEGLCEVHSGAIDVGLSRLSNVLERARLMPTMLREALIALIKANELVGRPEQSLIYLRELIAHMQKTRPEAALAHHRIHLERLGKTPQQDLGSMAFERREAQLQKQVAEKELIKTQADHESFRAEKDEARRALFRSRVEMLERMAVTAELRDDSTGEHSYRVGKLSSLLAHEFGCDEDTCFMIDIAARLHDIGKIGVPDAVLLKPGKLNDAELQVMRSHPIVGAELLSKSDTPHVQMAEEIARFHHEWWDGTGYPGNLSGSAIPLSARITSLADVFDALTHKRPYKEAWTFEDAMAEITRLGGMQFDPHLTGLFVTLMNRLRAEQADLDAFLGQAATATPFMQARAKIQSALHRRPGDDTGSGSRLDLQR